jgi:predicted component of type VI protein secretion system
MKKLLVLTILLGTLSGCSSSKPTRNKASERAKRMMTPRPQYAFVNNQIIIFENNY